MGAVERHTWDEGERANALVIYVDSGPAAASRLTGIPSATIRSWAHRTPGLQQLHVELTELQTAELNARAAHNWAETRSEVVRGLAGNAAALVNMVADYIEAGDPRNAKEATVALAVSIDKAQLLTGGATGRQEREVTATIRQGMLGEGRSKVMELLPPSRAKQEGAA